MNSLSLILRILALVSAIAAGAIFFIGKGKLAEMQTQLNSSQAAHAQTQGELDSAKEQIEKLEGNLRKERANLADTKRRLANERSEKNAALQEVSQTKQQLNNANSTISELENSLKRLRADLLKTEQELAAASKEAEIKQLNDRISELEFDNADLKEDLAKLKSGVNPTSSNANGALSTGDSNYTSGFKPSPVQALPQTSLGVETSIHTVSAENGLIVLENNPQLGLTAGLEVRVIKDYKDLGSIKIILIQDEIAVANILPGAKTRAMSRASTVNLMR